MRERTAALLQFEQPRLLSTDAQQAYVRMMDGEQLTREEPGVGELIAMHLAVQTSRNEQLFSALSARSAERVLRLRALTAVRQAADNALELTELMNRLEDQLPSAPPRPFTSSHGRLLVGSREIDEEIEVLVASARQSVWSAQPGAARPALLKSPKGSRDVRAMQRGVTYRTIYGSQARDCQSASEFATNATACGSAVRHTAHPFTRMIVFDGTTAVVPATHSAAVDADVDAGPNTPYAWLLTDRGSVDFATQQFELTWNNAQPWTATADPSTAPLTSPLQRQILRGLLSGRSQGDVATALGITQSYASTQLSLLRSKLGLTRDQLIAWWVDSPEQHIS
ncbi:hypothetical protein [Streptacidiphilus sp. EB103A]|uniref:hypothetical protein n=1 Tax=Streptacidiphilus sp. EB103A TaxID=3156275 RepID=UPI003512B2D7